MRGESLAVDRRSTLAHPGAPHGNARRGAPDDQDDQQEENIYEVMKEHMRRQKEELDAKNAQLRQQQYGGGCGRPGPVQPSSSPVIEKVENCSDLQAVWGATRKYLASTARYLDSVLGHCCRIESLNAESLEAVLLVPGNQKGFTNEKARLKIEEAIRVVTGLQIKLSLHFGEEMVKVPEADASVGWGGGAGGITAQRVPPEVIEAVKAQPIVRELMKKLDATVVHVELMGTGEAE
ncbi:MAG: hypothetical protein FWD61_10495 [Phycisphaerales bacterium]|nr:hypothetical protein [Phycisphaerales bacterium]